MKRMLKILLLLFLLPLLYVLAHLSLAYVTKYKPKEVETLVINQKASEESNPISDSTLTFLIWNVGYGGLGKDVDFFYDGGKMVITPEELVRKYINGINTYIESQKDVDFILLQEIDINSRRSKGVNMFDGILSILENHYSVFALNYKVRFLPFPWTEPLGRITSGLGTFSKSKPSLSNRVAFPGISDFPRKLFYLERCMMVNRYLLANGKELIVVNTHLEAYDDGGVKKKQMALMKEWLEKEFTSGNYVVIGGDWNIAPPDFDVHKWEKEKENDALYLKKNDPNYIKGWRYAYDPEVPTNRKNNKPMNGKTFTTVIDYFYLSPNIIIDEVKGVDAKFENSDHNPVKLKIRLQ